MGKTTLKLAALDNFTRLNMQKLIEEQNDELNASNENVTTETIEELDKLCQILEDK